jgi:hypothetical protein
MSRKLIARSKDLKQLEDEGYRIEVRHNHLIVHEVPYVTPGKVVALGKVVTDLTLNGDVTIRPGDHQVWFAGEHPCNADGSEISAIKHSSETRTLCEDVEINHRFSCKPPDGYPDYHAKVTRYVEIIQNQAKKIQPEADARVFRPIESQEDDSVFVYTDSAVSRAGIAEVARKLALAKVAIVGLGGTGSYVLDLIAKTPVREIHLFDGDEFLQHNAFRAPGAASLAELEGRSPKVEYFAARYQPMRKGIETHAVYIEEANVALLSGFDFVFICVDKPAVRKLVIEFLVAEKIPFVDSGMELELITESSELVGLCRVTMGTEGRTDHLRRYISYGEDEGDDLYKTNIQVADLNALCAVLSVIRFKKHCGFYQDCYKEHHSAYAINAHQLTRDEMLDSPTP